MSQVKTGFNWKTIEEKPHNWETIRHLIQDAYAPAVVARVSRNVSRSQELDPAGGTDKNSPEKIKVQETAVQKRGDSAARGERAHQEGDAKYSF